MAETILITGGAGFIGRYVARACLERGHSVRVLDSLIEQVHGSKSAADHLDPEVDVVVGDVRDEAAVKRALKGVTKVVHLAAEVGVGQSMYAVDRYVSVNDHGTAVLFQQLIDNPVKRVVVASSMSIYGEGLYRDADGTLVENALRRPRAYSASRSGSMSRTWCARSAPGQMIPGTRSTARVVRSSLCRRPNGSARPSPPCMH